MKEYSVQSQVSSKEDFPKNRLADEFSCWNRSVQSTTVIDVNKINKETSCKTDGDFTFDVLTSLTQ